LSTHSESLLWIHSRIERLNLLGLPAPTAAINWLLELATVANRGARDYRRSGDQEKTKMNFLQSS
jgi:hypothetical protein